MTTAATSINGSLSDTLATLGFIPEEKSRNRTDPPSRLGSAFSPTPKSTNNTATGTLTRWLSSSVKIARNSKHIPLPSEASSDDLVRSLDSSPASIFSIKSAVSSASSMPNSNYSPKQPSPASLSTSHPFAYHDLMNSTAVSSDKEDDDNCPVCLESLALRLQGEKPHVVPVCGHKLHEACFEAVYGSVVRARNRVGSLGLCGVCRRDMKVGDPADYGKNKFAALSGLPGGKNNSPLDTHKVRSISKRTIPADGPGGKATHDPNEDDLPLTMHNLGHAQRGSADTLLALSTNGAPRSKIVGGPFSPASSASSSRETPSTLAFPHVTLTPKITAKAEHMTVARNADREKKTNITCMITIEWPHRLDPHMRAILDGSSDAGLARSSTMNGSIRSAGQQLSSHAETIARSRAGSVSEDQSSHASASQFSPTGVPLTGRSSEADPYESIVQDLTDRMADWKGHSPRDFGKLHMFDLLNVRKDQKIREFYIYLFSEALLCVSDDARKPGAPPSDKLRLKGRVFIRHIGKVESSSDRPGQDNCAESSLTISMQDEETPDAFVIVFNNATQLQTWRQRIENLVHAKQASVKPSRSFNSVRESTHSGDTYHSHSAQSSITAQSSTYSKYSRTTVSSANGMHSKEMGVLEEEPFGENHYENGQAPYPRSTNGFATESLLTLKSPSQCTYPPLNLPHDFPSSDLLLIFSVPAPTNAPSSFQLKIRLIKSTLDFVINNVGPRGRISIITYSCGENGKGSLRKSPLLAVGRPDSKARLQTFIESIGTESAMDADSYSAVDQRDDRVSVVTAVNLALDVVLQRRAKSSLTGIILTNDGRDGAQKQQMDLAMARAEAAAVPIHTFGWGRGHDPSSLWLLSNHTRGSYTFVKDLYGLRESVAGCVGSILSIIANSVKLYVSVQEPRWFRIRKVAGVSNSIVSSDGREVDIMLGEMRSGEKREILVEVEMGNSGPRRPKQSSYNTATDDFLRNAGMDPLALRDDSSDSYDDDYYTLIDEVPLFEVNASFRDPIAAKHFSRLPQPCPLLVTITPPNETHKPSPANSDPAVVKRRVELLCSDMQTRCLLLMSRKNPQQAQRLLSETKRIIGTILTNLANIAQDGREKVLSIEHATTAKTLSACIEDIDSLMEGIEQQRELFDTVHRNAAAQSAVILRDQLSHTGKSSTERLFWTADFSLWMSHRSQEWLSPA